MRAGIECPPLVKDGSSHEAEITQVTLKEALGFLAKAINPFQSPALHSSRGSFHAARQKVDGCPHANGYGHAELAIVPRDPFFGFRTAKCDEEQIGPGETNSTDDFLIIHFLQGAERRRV